MRIRLLTILAAAAILFGCTEKNGTTPDNIDTDLSGAPELPADPQPENISFDHRIMLLQHTGTGCSNCPRMMTSLKELSQDKEYNSKYVHVAAHSYNSDDPCYSTAAKQISDPFCTAWPELSFNLSGEKTDGDSAIPTIKQFIDKLHKETADVGIAAAAKIMNDGKLGIIAELKAAVENNYRIAVWLLEDGIESEQMGATAEWQHTHNNALRAMAGSSLNLRIYGAKAGLIPSGEKYASTFVIEMEEGWKSENCKVLILANAHQPDGRVDVANCVICPIGKSVTYDYR